MFTELHATDDNRIAAYADGSGPYSIHFIPADGDDPAVLITVIAEDEFYADTVVRAPELDGNDWRDWMHTDAFGSEPETGDHGAMILNGEAYLITGEADGYVIVAFEITDADA